MPSDADRPHPDSPSTTVGTPAGLLDVVADPAFAWRSMGGGIVSRSRAAERHYGYTRQEALGRVSHDLLRTELTGTSFALEVLGQKLEARMAPETAGIRKVADLVDQAITQARTLARGPQPVTLEATGLVTAPRDLAAKAESMFRVSCPFVGEDEVLVYDNTIATHLYRIAQEAIGNAVKQGKARTIVVDLSAERAELRLTVTDDGVGLGNAAPAKGGKGIGLEAMGYRARAIGGRLDVRAGERVGTMVLCTAPVSGEHAEDDDVGA